MTTSTTPPTGTDHTNQTDPSTTDRAKATSFSSDSHVEFPLSTRRALITGGSRGIGAACAIELARLGADIVITHRSSSEAAEDVLAACRAHGVAAQAVQAELGPHRPGEEIVQAAGDDPGYDIVIDNAPAPFPRVSLPQIDADDLADKARMDVAALHRLCTAFTPSMAARGFGRIIVISSGASWGPTAPGLAPHGIAKAAQEAYVRYAATELLAGTTVTINALQLGFVATEGSSPVPPPARQALTAATPAGRVAQPSDIASVVGLLAQPASGWINGTTIPVTGGMNYPLNIPAVLSIARSGPEAHNAHVEERR